MLGSLSPVAMLLWLGVVLRPILLVGALAARVIPGKGSEFILELPPLRVPRPGNILVKTVARIEWYLKEAVPLFVLGTLILFVADRLNVLSKLEAVAAPLLHGLLDSPGDRRRPSSSAFSAAISAPPGLYHLCADRPARPRAGRRRRRGHHACSFPASRISS